MLRRPKLVLRPARPFCLEKPAIGALGSPLSLWSDFQARQSSAASVWLRIGKGFGDGVTPEKLPACAEHTQGTGQDRRFDWRILGSREIGNRIVNVEPEPTLV